MALFFGFVTQMASQLQTLNTPMPSQFLLILPYVATIIAVAGLVGRVERRPRTGSPSRSDVTRPVDWEGAARRSAAGRCCADAGVRAVLGLFRWGRRRWSTTAGW